MFSTSLQRSFCFFLFSLVSFVSSAQFSFSGKVSAAQKPVEHAEVYLTQLGKSTVTNAKGVFEFGNLPAGTYKLVIFSFEYETLKQTLALSGDTALQFQLDPLSEQLSEVIIQNRRKEIFALRHLRDEEGTAIYAGKKSEVVQLENVAGNKASNTARQIYAQVVGLNIYDNSDGGLQLNVGGRGLDPNRTANFNTRQNGYDISADVLGYPESYYTPPAEALDEIEVVRGAAALQYGTQFGGLINFKLHQPNSNKKIELVSRQSLGSYNLFTSFNSLSGTLGKVGYYTYFNYKKGDGFRPNSQFESKNAYAHVDYDFSDKTSIALEMSYLDYLAQQPGGLTDKQFEEDPTFSNRTRNWFKVDWKLFALKLKHQFSEETKFSLNLFTLDASRKSVGFRERRVTSVDVLDAPRELIDGRFNNWGAEARVLTHYDFFDQKNSLLLGAKYYQSNNSSRQGPGTNGSDANFHFATETYPDYARQSDFDFPNLNLSFFGENIFKLSSTFSVTPGFRFEYIKTQSEGAYKKINFDNAGNPILNQTIPDNREFEREFLLLGLGLSYKPSDEIEFYGNFSQNYRSVTFNDIRINNPSLTVDPDITDEDGFTTDVGVRGKINRVLSYDVSGFFLKYNNRIGVRLRELSDIEQDRFRGNIGDAITYGVESFADWNIWQTFSNNRDFHLHTFVNLALTGSDYTASEAANVKGNEVEFIPALNLKTGIGFGYKDLLANLQYTYLSKQYTDATNSKRDFTSTSGIIGEIPSYDILDLSLSYTYKHFRLETGINNLLDNSYFTRRATGYPGPGIIPSQPRTWYATLQFKF